MSVRTFIRGSIFTVFALMATLPAFAQGVGAIGGTVTDASGGVLPGVSVTLSSAGGGAGSNQTTTSNDQGAYQFLRLSPGTYIVKAELQGFRPAEQRGIVVNSDVTARADLKLEIGSLSEGVTVSGEAPLLDTTTALRQTVISREALEAMPNRSDVWAIAKMLPGVTLSKVDVGGSEGFLQSSATVHGNSNENKYTIDGLDVSSLDGNATIATMYLDPYAFQETNFMMGAGSAENSNGGLTFNMVTRTGTNQTHGGFTLNGATPGMANINNLSADLEKQLLASVPQSVKDANPNLSPNANVTRWYDFGAFLSGPVVKDKLWYSLTWHQQRFNDYKLGNYNLDGTQVLDDNWMWTSSAKAAWQMTKSGQLSYFNNLQYKLIGHRGGGTFGDGAARQYNFKYPDVHQVKFTTPIGSKMVVDSSYNRFRADDCFCRRPEVKNGDVAVNDTTAQSQTVALATYNANKMFRDQVRIAASYFAGKHDLRFGYEGMKGGEKSRVWTVSGMRANMANGVPQSVNTYALPITQDNTSSGDDIPDQFQNWSIDNGVYVQDRFTATRRLVLNVGVRYETNSSYEPATCRPDTVFAGAGACFAKVQAPSFKDASPRFNLVYDLRGDGKTALKFAANRYNVPINISAIARLNPVATTSDQRTWLDQSKCASVNNIGCDLNGDKIPQANELGPSPGFVFAGVNARYATDIKRPVSNEYTAEWQQQLPLNMVLSVGYTNRQTRRNPVQQNTAPAADISLWPASTVTEVTSGQVVTVYNRPSTATANLFFSSDLANTDYKGTDITLNKRMSHHFSVTGGATFGQTTQNTQAAASAAGDINNPNNSKNPYFKGQITGGDRPWSYRASGVIELPWSIQFSGTQVVQAGNTETTIVQVTNATITLAQGNQNVQVKQVGDVRYPVLLQTDLSLRKNFRLQGSRTISPRVDFFNATNQSTITARVVQLGPTYHNPSGVQRGAVIKASVTMEF